MSLPRPQRRMVAASPKTPEPATITEPIAADFRPSDTFVFDPKLNTITVADLAEIIAALDIRVHFERYLKFSETLQKHFRHRKL